MEKYPYRIFKILKTKDLSIKVFITNRIRGHPARISNGSHERLGTILPRWTLPGSFF
jgi:hypothetical protein